MENLVIFRSLKLFAPFCTFLETLSFFRECAADRIAAITDSAGKQIVPAIASPIPKFPLESCLFMGLPSAYRYQKNSLGLIPGGYVSVKPASRSSSSQ